MGQIKGQTGNPNGRPKGAGNKVTTEVRTWISGLIDANRKQIIKDLKALEPKDRLAAIEKLMAYVVPKVSTMQINFDQLSESQLDLIVAELSQNLNTDENEN